MERWRALDDLRGLTILLMIPVNALMEFSLVPAWAKHAAGPGLTAADLVLPAFVFALGLSGSFSRLRRLGERGFWPTLGHGALRYGLLFGFGTIGYFFVWGQANWEVLQLLGLAGALAFAASLLPPWPRRLAAPLLILACELLRPWGLEASFRDWYASGTGGPWGCLPYAGLAMGAGVLGEALAGASTGARVRLCLGSGGAALLLGLGAWLWQGPPDKHLVNLAFLGITGGLACLALGICAALEDHLSLPWLSALGRNPLLMYMVSGILILPLRAALPADSPLPLALGAMLAVLGACLALAWWLERRGFRLRL